MITTIVRYRVPASIDAATIDQHLRDIAPGFRGVPGLVRKQMIYSPDDRTAGGVYLWEDRAAAEMFYSGTWLHGFRDRFGIEPEVTYYETPAVADNRHAEIVMAPVTRGPGNPEVLRFLKRAFRTGSAVHPGKSPQLDRELGQ